MTTVIAPIVGMYFRLKEDGVPAQAIINNLPAGTPLELVAEPDNPFDPNAIKVVLNFRNVPHNSDIEFAVNANGMTNDELYTNNHHLGYVDSKKTGCAARLSPDLGKVTSSTLCFSAEGKPGVKVELTEE